MKINIKKVSMVMVAVLIVGVVGSLLTYRSRAGVVPVEEIKTFEASEITALDITTRNTSVNIYPTDDDKIQVALVGNSSINTEYSLNIEVEGSTLVAKVKERQISLINIGFFSESVTLNIYLPEKQYEELMVNSTNGAIVAEDLQVNQLQLKGNNGRIRLDNIVSQETIVKNQNGGTTVNNHEGNLNVGSSNGRITLEDIKGNLQAETSNGSINFVAETIHQDIKFQTSNGSISIDLEKEPENATFILTSNNGSTKVFGESTTYKVFGDGENTIELSSRNGSIRVN